MRTAALGGLLVGLTVAGLGLAQPLPTPAVPSTPTVVERFVTWVKTPPRAARPRNRTSAEADNPVELPATPAPGESNAPLLPAASAAAAPASPPSVTTAPTPAETSLMPAPPLSRRFKLGLRSAKAQADTTVIVPPANSGTEAPLLAAPALVAPAPPASGAIPPPTLEPEPPPDQLPPPTRIMPESPAIVTPNTGLEPTLDFSDVVFVYDSPGAYWTSVDFLIWRVLRGPLA